GVDDVVVPLRLTEASGMVDRSLHQSIKSRCADDHRRPRTPWIWRRSLKAVLDKRIRASLDVVDPEPLPADHPLWHAEGALITPHVAGSSTAFLGRAWRFVGEQCRRHLDGEPLLNVVSEGY